MGTRDMTLIIPLTLLLSGCATYRPLEQANLMYKRGDYENAALAYRQISNKPHLRIDVLGKATFNLGLTLMKQKEYEDAIAAFSTLLESEVNDKDPGNHLMEIYANYRNKACVNISECYEMKQDYSHALEYYMLSLEKYPYRTSCFTCRRSSTARKLERLEELVKKANQEEIANKSLKATSQ
jgi:tetratricopeptide (TPR) repeat protein